MESFRWDTTNSSGDRVVAVENVQSVRRAFFGFDHNDYPPRAELGQPGHLSFVPESPRQNFAARIHPAWQRELNGW